MYYKSVRWNFLKDPFALFYAFLGVGLLVYILFLSPDYKDASMLIKIAMPLNILSAFMLTASRILFLQLRSLKNAGMNIEAKYGTGFIADLPLFRNHAQEIKFERKGVDYQGMLIQDPKTSEPVLSSVTEIETGKKINSQEWIVPEARMPALASDESIVGTPSGAFSNDAGQQNDADKTNE